MSYKVTGPVVLNVHDAKTHLSRYLARVEQGETIILSRRNEPVAELRPIRKKRTTARPLGLARGQFVLGTQFDEPLPDEFVSAFSGDDE